MCPEPLDEAKSIDNAALMRDLRPALVRYFLRRCKSPAEAEDLAQDVVVRALAHVNWTSREHARKYIFRIAANLWRDRGRMKLAHGKVIAWDDEIDYGQGEEITVERVVSGQDELQRVYAALMEMHERTREVLVLFRLEGMRQAEIAEALGISVSAVEKHVVKGLAHLAGRMMHADRESNDF